MITIRSKDRKCDKRDMKLALKRYKDECGEIITKKLSKEEMEKYLKERGYIK